jgi:hypothetical protein
LAVHVPVGLLAVITGFAAMLIKKGRGAHTRFGTIYFWSLAIMFMTSAGLSAIRWSQDYHLFLLGTLAFSTAILGRLARRRNWKINAHIVAMGSSYIAVLTAFYVDNGRNLPLWRDLPYIAYWTMPSLVGAPIILWILRRDHPNIMHSGGLTR